MGFKVIKLKTKRDINNHKGSLTFFETLSDIHFEIKRVYYIYGVDRGVERGGHAHLNLIQILFCPYGSIELKLDDGENVNTITLDDPSIGLVLSPIIWREMNWKIKDSVLCVACSDKYMESDYLRSYEDFKKYKEVKK